MPLHMLEWMIYHHNFYTKEKYMISLIINLLVGGIAGWLAGKIMNNQGSMLRNTILGIIGGTVGGLVLGLIGIHGSGFIGNIAVSVVGSCIVIWLVDKIR